MPVSTIRAADEAQRLAYHAELVRLLGLEDLTYENDLPEPVFAGAAGASMAAPIGLLAQAKRYVRDAGLRAAVVRSMLDALPASGDVVIVAHSLGSLSRSTCCPGCRSGSSSAVS